METPSVIRQQNEFLPLIVAHMAGAGEEIDSHCHSACVGRASRTSACR
jgi:hypothetical protein